MFDKYFVDSSPSHVTHNVSVTEKRAPTDDSVRLLKEMEAAAQSKVDASVRLNDNEFHAVMHIHQSMLDYDRKFKVIYSLNGKRIITDFAIDLDARLDEIVSGLVDAVSKDVAAHILRKPIESAVRAQNLHSPPGRSERTSD